MVTSSRLAFSPSPTPAIVPPVPAEQVRAAGMISATNLVVRVPFGQVFPQGFVDPPRRLPHQIESEALACPWPG